MPDPVSVSSLNPFGSFSFGGLSTMGNVLMVIVIALLLLGCIGFFLYWWFIRKTYWIRIHVFRLVGNNPTRVSIFSAREVAFGGAGDKLWRVASAGIWKIKVLKWLPVGKIQTAPNEFWYWLRSDGEWINFAPSDIDEISKKMNVKFVQEDMRLQRLATDRLLEQRHMQKTFWEQWRDTIMLVIFFLVIAVCMVLIFWQFSKLLDKLLPLVERITESLKIVQYQCNFNSTTSGSLTPA